MGIKPEIFLNGRFTFCNVLNEMCFKYLKSFWSLPVKI